MVEEQILTYQGIAQNQNEIRAQPQFLAFSGECQSRQVKPYVDEKTIDWEQIPCEIGSMYEEDQECDSEYKDQILNFDLQEDQPQDSQQHVGPVVPMVLPPNAQEVKQLNLVKSTPGIESDLARRVKKKKSNPLKTPVIPPRKSDLYKSNLHLYSDAVHQPKNQETPILSPKKHTVAQQEFVVKRQDEPKIEKTVDVLVIGGGPATLGMFINALKNNKFQELIQDDGIAIIESGLSFGGGNLTQYGINSNTSANSFLKCILRKYNNLGKQIEKLEKEKQASTVENGNVVVTAAKVKDKKNLQTTQKNIENTQRQKNRKLSENKVEGFSTHKFKPISEFMSPQGKSDARDNTLIQVLSQVALNNNTSKVSEQSLEKIKNCNDSKSNDYEDKDPINSTVVILKNQQVQSSQSSRRSRIKTSSRVGSAVASHASKTNKIAINTKIHTSRYTHSKTNGDENSIEPKLESGSSKKKQQDKFISQLRKSATFRTPQVPNQLCSTQVRGSANNRSNTKPVNNGTNTPNYNQLVGLGATQKKKLASSSQRTSSVQIVGLNNIKNLHKLYVASNAQLQEFSSAKEDDKEEEQNIPLSVASQHVLTPFKDLATCSIVQTMRKLGKQVVPLSLAGHMLNSAGNYILNHVWQLCQKRIFFPKHKAVSIQLLPGGCMITKVVRTDFHLEADPKSSPPFFIVNQSETITYIRSKAVILACGATQFIPKDTLKNSICPNIDLQKVITSDDFLKRETFSQKCEMLNQLKIENESKPRRVVIIGGSHSGFSCAWMLVNGPASHANNHSGQVFHKGHLVQKKTIKSCIECCKCVQKAQKNCAAAIPVKTGTFGTSIRHTGVKQDQVNKQMADPSCQCLCKCLGVFSYNDWSTLEASQLPNFRAGIDEINILYRDRIRVYYKNIEKARAAGYDELDKDQFGQQNGYIYAFTGLRGDAKKLYQDIKSGSEERIKLIKAPTPQDQRPYLEQADIVIWACGYQTNSIPILDHNKKVMPLSQRVANTQFDVDKKCRVLLDDGCRLNKVFACGVGFPIRIKEGKSNSKNIELAAGSFSNKNLKRSQALLLKGMPPGSNMSVNWNQNSVAPLNYLLNPRADSFSLYTKQVGDILLKNIFPKKNIELYVQHKELVKDEQAVSQTRIGLGTSRIPIEQLSLASTQKKPIVPKQSRKSKVSQTPEPPFKQQRMKSQQFRQTSLGGPPTLVNKAQEITQQQKQNIIKLNADIEENFQEETEDPPQTLNDMNNSIGTASQRVVDDKEDSSSSDKNVAQMPDYSDDEDELEREVIEDETIISAQEGQTCLPNLKSSVFLQPQMQISQTAIQAVAPGNTAIPIQAFKPRESQDFQMREQAVQDNLNRRKKSFSNYQSKITQLKQIQMAIDYNKVDGSNLGMYTQSYSLQKEIEKINKKRKKRGDNNTKLSSAYGQNEPNTNKTLNMPKRKRVRHNSKLNSQDYTRREPVMLSHININPQPLSQMPKPEEKKISAEDDIFVNPDINLNEVLEPHQFSEEIKVLLQPTSDGTPGRNKNQQANMPLQFQTMVNTMQEQKDRDFYQTNKGNHVIVQSASQSSSALKGVKSLKINTEDTLPIVRRKNSDATAMDAVTLSGKGKYGGPVQLATQKMQEQRLFDSGKGFKTRGAEGRLLQRSSQDLHSNEYALGGKSSKLDYFGTATSDTTPGLARKMKVNSTTAAHSNKYSQNKSQKTNFTELPSIFRPKLTVAPVPPKIIKNFDDSPSLEVMLHSPIKTEVKLKKRASEARPSVTVPWLDDKNDSLQAAIGSLTIPKGRLQHSVKNEVRQSAQKTDDDENYASDQFEVLSEPDKSSKKNSPETLLYKKMIQEKLSKDPSESDGDKTSTCENVSISTIKKIVPFKGSDDAILESTNSVKNGVKTNKKAQKATGYKEITRKSNEVMKVSQSSNQLLLQSSKHFAAKSKGPFPSLQSRQEKEITHAKKRAAAAYSDLSNINTNTPQRKSSELLLRTPEPKPKRVSQTNVHSATNQSINTVVNSMVNSTTHNSNPQQRFTNSVSQQKLQVLTTKEQEISFCPVRETKAAASALKQPQIQEIQVKMKIQQQEAQYKEDFEQLKNKIMNNQKKKNGFMVDNFSPILKGRKNQGRTAGPTAITKHSIEKPAKTGGLVYGESSYPPTQMQQSSRQPEFKDFRSPSSGKKYSKPIGVFKRLAAAKTSLEDGKV